jgi:hypothetical protein
MVWINIVDYLERRPVLTAFLATLLLALLPLMSGF